MSSSFSNSDPPDTAEASQQRLHKEGGPKQGERLDYEAEAVKTFEFEVSAGRSAKLTGARSVESSASLLAESPAQRSVESPAQRSVESPAQRSKSPAQRSAVSSRRRSDDASSIQASLLDAPSSTVAAPVVSTDRQVVGPGKQTKISSTKRSGTQKPGQVATRHVTQTARLAAGAAVTEQVDIASHALPTARLARRRASWWIVSLGLHALLLLCLAFTTLVVFQEQEQLELYTTAAVYESVEEFQDLEIDPADALESLEEDIATELNEPEAATFADLSSESLLEQPALAESALSESNAVQLPDSLAEMGQLFGDNGSGMSELGTAAGGAMVKFFGTEVKARRILYMLDNSGGMLQGGKFEALISELQASVSVLKDKQKFYVIFFSDTVYPLFYPHSVRKFMPATEKNRIELQLWLDSVELCTGNAIDEALAAAEVIRPDAVFLLTDGNLFTTEKKKSLLLSRAGRPYSIHTFGLGVGEQTRTAAGLKQIAEANEGTFRAIKVSAAAKELAFEKQRPYHSKVPGAVWGLKVGLR